MLFLLFGSSAAGKTAALDELRGRVACLAVHDFDEIGVPPGADAAWRQRANEQWLRRALTYQAEGTDLLLAGQTPLAELLAAPSAPRLEAISACLIDCDDDTRVARLQARGPEWLAGTGGTLENYVNWAAWLRDHAADPTRRIHVVDTSELPVEEVGTKLIEWIAAERALLRSAALDS